MKARLRTPWRRVAAPGYIPPPIDPYRVAVVTTQLQAAFPKVAVVVHSVDQSSEVVVELREGTEVWDVPEEVYADLQRAVDMLVEQREVCVFVPVDGLIPPVAYQRRMIPFVDAGPGTSWHPVLWTDQPGVFADLEASVDFTAEAQALQEVIVAVLTRAYVEEQGRGGEAPATPVVCRADQDVRSALEVLAMELWVYPDTVEAVYAPEEDVVRWVWKGTVEAYSGPARSGVDVGAKVSLAGLPAGYRALGVGVDVGAKVQRALGEVVDVKRWRTVVLVSGPQADVCRLLARSLKG